MWKAQLRSKTNTPQIDLDIRPTPKRTKRNCREEFRAMQDKIKSKADSLRGNAQLSETQGIDTYFNTTGLDMHYATKFQLRRDEIPEEFFCRLLDAIKSIKGNNFFREEVKFEFNGQNYLVFYTLSYEPSAGLSYFNYSGMSVTVRAESEDVPFRPSRLERYWHNTNDDIIYMGFSFRGRDGYSNVPKPDFNTWKWW